MSDIVVTPKATPGTPDGGYTYDEVHPIAGLLGLDSHRLSDSDKFSLKSIYDFVRGDQSEMTELELLAKVRSMEQKLGLTSLGERRVDKIYRYVKLQGQIDHLTTARDQELR